MSLILGSIVALFCKYKISYGVIWGEGLYLLNNHPSPPPTPHTHTTNEVTKQGSAPAFKKENSNIC